MESDTEWEPLIRRCDETCDHDDAIVLDPRTYQANVERVRSMFSEFEQLMEGT